MKDKSDYWLKSPVRAGSLSSLNLAAFPQGPQKPPAIFTTIAKSETR
jgi:hypothetical protein